MKRSILLPMFACVVLSACEHKTPTASDISDSLTQELADYPMISVSDVKYINGIARPDGSHDVTAQVVLKIKQPEDAVKYYADEFKFIQARAKINAEIPQAESAIQQKYQAMEAPLQQQLDALPVAGDLETVQKVQVRATEINSEIANLDNQERTELGNTLDGIARKLGFASLEAFNSANSDAFRFGPNSSFIAPGYQKLSWKNNLGGKLAMEIIECKEAGLQTCAQKIYTSSFDVNANMIKTDNGWVINEND